MWTLIVCYAGLTLSYAATTYQECVKDYSIQNPDGILWAACISDGGTKIYLKGEPDVQHR